MPQATRADDRDRALAVLLRDAVDAAGISQYVLAQEVGVSPSTVGRYLRGETAIPAPHFIAIALAAGADMHLLYPAALAALAAIPVPDPKAPKRRSPVSTPSELEAAKRDAFKAAQTGQRPKQRGGGASHSGGSRSAG